MELYNFDLFVVDVNRYNVVGDWMPNKSIFSNGEFENTIQPD
jgi:hypothetical protein